MWWVDSAPAVVREGLLHLRAGSVTSAAIQERHSCSSSMCCLHALLCTHALVLGCEVMMGCAGGCSSSNCRSLSGVMRQSLPTQQKVSMCGTGDGLTALTARTCLLVTPIYGVRGALLPSLRILQPPLLPLR
jgi:hypothetical protein